MKKILSVLIFIVSAFSLAFGFAGCRKTEFNDNLPFKTALVSIDYSDKVTNKASLSIGNESEKFDVSGCDFYNKSDKKKVKQLVGGDRLEIYYSDENSENIDHVLVKKAKALVLELSSAYVNGSISEGKRLYSEKQGVFVNNTEYGAYWVIDRSGNYINLDKIDDNTKIYGTYIEEEDLITSQTPYITKVHYLHALYLYNPM